MQKKFLPYDLEHCPQCNKQEICILLSTLITPEVIARIINYYKWQGEYNVLKSVEIDKAIFRGKYLILTSLGNKRDW